MEENITLYFDIHKNYEILKQSKYFLKISEYSNNNKNISLMQTNMLMIYSKCITTVFIVENMKIIKLNPKQDSDIILDKLLLLFYKTLKQENSKIDTYDIHKCNFFEYVANQSLVDFFDSIIKEIIIIVKKIIELFKINLEITEEKTNFVTEIYKIIADKNQTLNNIINDRIYYIAYGIPTFIEIEQNKYEIKNIIGIGNFGYVILYEDDDKNKKCIKNYFFETRDKNKIEIINKNEKIKDFFISSLYLSKYKSVFINNGNIILGKKNKVDRKEYILMDYGEKIYSINNKNIIIFIQNVIYNILNLYTYDIYFTDLKLENILYSPITKEIKFIDFDSFYFKEIDRKHFTFSYKDLIEHLLPKKNADCNLIYHFKKMIVFKISLLIMKLYNLQLSIMKKENFYEEWIKIVDNLTKDDFNNIKIKKYEVNLLYDMQSQNIEMIPELNILYEIFLEL